MNSAIRVFIFLVLLAGISWLVWQYYIEPKLATAPPPAAQTAPAPAAAPTEPAKPATP